MNTQNTQAVPLDGTVKQATFSMGDRSYIVLEIGTAPATPSGKELADENKENTATENNAAKVGKKYVYGLAGLANLFGCSKSTAYNIKRSGKINSAISQIGNTIVVDAELALSLAKK